MSKRGRQSAASLEIQARPVEIMDRQRAPHDLNDEETEVWSAVVMSWPADWFSPATAPLRSQYCRHVVQARRIAELIEKSVSDPELSLAGYDRLLKIQERESRAIATLATKMRITQQATTNHRGNQKTTAARKPWE